MLLQIFKGGINMSNLIVIANYIILFYTIGGILALLLYNIWWFYISAKAKEGFLKDIIANTDFIINYKVLNIIVFFLSWFTVCVGIHAFCMYMYGLVGLKYWQLQLKIINKKNELSDKEIEKCINLRR